MAWLYYLMAFVGGAGFAVQAGVNAGLRQYMNHPMQASLVSFAVGAVAALVYCLATGVAWPGAAVVTRAPPWVWIGGLLGLFLVWATIVSAPRVGAAATIACIVTGQAVTSLLLDRIGALGLPVHEATPLRIAGILLVVAGTVLVTLGR